MNVLITGGFGLVGGRLGQQLERAGHRVALGSRFARPSPEWLTGAEIRRTDWDDERVLQACCETMDVVVHAAGMNAQDATRTPVAAFHANAVATGRLVRAAGSAGVRRFLYLSTAHVYGTALVGRITEETCARNLHPYAASHRAGEDLVRYLCAPREEGTSVVGVVVRLSNTFGAPASVDAPCWNLLVNELCRQAAVEGKVELRTSGVQERDFIPLRDTCRALEHLAVSTRLPDDGIVNVGSGRAMSVLAMAKLVQARADALFGGAHQLVRPAPARGETAASLAFDISRLQETGFVAAGDVVGEIDELLMFCRARFPRDSAGR